MTNPNVSPNVQANGQGEPDNLKDLARQLGQLIILHERQMDAQAKESQAQVSRIEVMARALNDLRDQNLNLLQQAQATMEAAVAVINGADEQLDKLTEIALALTTVYEEAQTQQEEL